MRGIGRGNERAHVTGVEERSLIYVSFPPTIAWHLLAGRIYTLLQGDTSGWQ